MRCICLAKLSMALFTISSWASEQSRPEFASYIYPLPESRLVSIKTSILFRPAAGYSAEGVHISASGEVSGVHSGRLVLSDDGKTTVFKPDSPFYPGEAVEVILRYAAEQYRFAFEVSNNRKARRFDPHEELFEQAALFTAPFETSSVNVDTTALIPRDFPQLALSQFGDTDSGFVFVSNFAFGDIPFTVSYLMILRNDGTPVFFRRMPERTVDFKPHPNGLLSYFDRTIDAFILMDNGYALVDTITAGNGYVSDQHELLLVQNDHAWLMIYDPQTMDMSEIVAGGHPEAEVVGLVIQELDSNDNVVFEWRSWDHFDILDATELDFTEESIDYAHGNAIEVDFDGNIMISSRHMDEITKIDTETGDIIWRMGGKNNEFQFEGPGSSLNLNMFFRQHAIRRLEDGHITLYDNGNFHQPPFSRALEYELDEENKIARLVWQYRNTPDTYGDAMGYVQRLPNGNTLIGWGSTNPSVTEVTPAGEKLWELNLPERIFSYRAFRFPWQGVAAAPYTWLETEENNLQIFFTQFGKEDIVKYYLYRGLSPKPRTRVDSTASKTIVVSELQPGTTVYFQITSVDQSGVESAFSNQLEYEVPFSTSVSQSQKDLPQDFVLKQNYPNPFNPSTTIEFGLPISLPVTVRVFNILGKEINTLLEERLQPGVHRIIWDGRDARRIGVSSGVYLYQLEAGEKVLRGKMLLLR